MLQAWARKAAVHCVEAVVVTSGVAMFAWGTLEQKHWNRRVERLVASPALAAIKAHPVMAKWAQDCETFDRLTEIDSTLREWNCDENYDLWNALGRPYKAVDPVNGCGEGLIPRPSLWLRPKPGFESPALSVVVAPCKTNILKESPAFNCHDLVASLAPPGRSRWWYALRFILWPWSATFHAGRVAEGGPHGFDPAKHTTLLTAFQEDPALMKFTCVHAMTGGGVQFGDMFDTCGREEPIPGPAPAPAPAPTPTS
jgi:hypothetical protein